MFLFRRFLVQIILFIIVLFSTSYFLESEWSYWFNIVLLIVFVIYNTITTIILIDDFQDIEESSWGSIIGSTVGGMLEGYTGNPTGIGIFQALGESLGGYFDKEGINYSNVRRRIYIESFLTYALIILSYYLFG